MPARDLDALLKAVLASSKYRSVSPDLIRGIGAQELAKQSSMKQAIKATKSKLHQVIGAYTPSVLDNQKAQSMLLAAAASPLEMEDVCRLLMQRHASTHERLPIVDTFFKIVLERLPPVSSVVDIACGLNPLARPWMPFAPHVRYDAYDAYGGAVEIVRSYFEAAGVTGQAAVRDVVADPPDQKVDLAFLLKTVPCLEHLGKTAVSRLLDGLNARHLVISYPVASLVCREDDCRCPGADGIRGSDALSEHPADCRKTGYAGGGGPGLSATRATRQYSERRRSPADQVVTRIEPPSGRTESLYSR